MIVFFLVVPSAAAASPPHFHRCSPISAMLAVGLAAYGAVFAWVGARLKRPLVIGLVFAFGWEPAVLLFPGYLKRLTVAYYLQALVPHAMPQDSAVSMLMQVFHEVPAVPTSLLSLAAIIARDALGGRAVTVESRGIRAGTVSRTCVRIQTVEAVYHDNENPLFRDRFAARADGRPRDGAGGLLRRDADERLLEPRRSGRAPLRARAMPPSSRTRTCRT